MYVIKKFLLFSLVLLVVALFIPLKENQTLVKLQNDVRSKVQQVMNQDSSLKNNTLKTPTEQDFAINNIQMKCLKTKLKINWGNLKE